MAGGGVDSVLILDGAGISRHPLTRKHLRSPRARVAINGLLKSRMSVTPRSHSEMRKLLGELGREDLRALYSDLVEKHYMRRLSIRV